MRLRLAEVAAAVGGRLAEATSAGVEIDGASIDTRTIRPGQLFVPVVGERDGHDFIAAARAAGAVAWFTLGDRPGAHDAGAVVVSDTSDVLTRLGSLARTRLPDRVIGVTGSAGKTSTKDLLASILRAHGPAAASEKSFNNELGVPLTLANAPDDAWAAVIEMGARGKGHIALLCDVAHPTVGVITNIGTAHRELFVDEDATADAKGELLQSLPADGVAVLNRDDPRFERLAALAPCRIAAFSARGDERAELRAVEVQLDDDLHPSFGLVTPAGAVRVRVAARGMHQVANALAAAGAALAVGASLDEIARGLGDAPLSPWRMELSTAPSGARILNDAYNANPASVRAALESLAQLPAARRIAVLGVMAELGDDGPALHREVASYASSLGITVIAVGTDAYGLAGGAVAAVVRDVEEAVTALGTLGDPDVVLVKGSRVAGLERLALHLLEGPRP